MRITGVARTAMKFVTPAQYSKTNEAHMIINRAAVLDFLKVHPPLDKEDRLIDFGCGTGETTASMARGELGGLGHPGQVVGVDISPSMVSHSQEHHQAPGLQFDRVDVEDANHQDKFLDQFSMMTSFSCLHWVPNQPAAVQFFNKSLKKNGKFLFVISSTQSSETNILRREWESMKQESKWAEILVPCSWPHFKTVHTNNSWMSTVDNNGMGHIIQDDYVKLMQNHGFQVDDCQTLPLNYRFTKDFTRNFFKSTILSSFPELNGDVRKEFFDEYIARAKEHGEQHDQDGLVNGRVEGIQIFGKKIKNS